MEKGMNDIKLMRVCFGGVEIQVPEIWNVDTEMYTEPDGRECAMLDVSAASGDPRSVVISYGPMPEGSDALIEAEDTYADLLGESGLQPEESPVCEYDFLGRTAFGFELETEDNLACNFICAAIGDDDSAAGSKLLTVLTTAKSYEDIDDLLDLLEENIVLQ
jgi:hypothetical protein